MNPGDLGDHRLIGAKVCGFHHFSRKGRPQDALHRKRHVDAQLAAGIVQGSARAQAGPGRAAVYLAIGEDAHIATVVGGVLRRADEDRAVEETQIRFKGVFDLHIFHDSMFDAHTGGDQLVKIFLC